MKNLLRLLPACAGAIFFFSFPGFSQTVCGVANEGQSITLIAPPGNSFTSIEFASYGTPTGSCGSFTVDPVCNATTSVGIAEGLFLGQTTATIDATNDVFGDPCGGTGKRLYIQVRYSSTLPLTLVSFQAEEVANGTVQLSWTTGSETNTDRFVIERTTGNLPYAATGTLPAAHNSVTQQHYQFIDPITPGTAYQYRIRMIDIDGHFRYSPIAYIRSGISGNMLYASSQSDGSSVMITSPAVQIAWLISTTGQVLQQLSLVKGSQSLSLASVPAGLYLIKTATQTVKVLKRR